MKTILITIALLIGMVGMAQNILIQEGQLYSVIMNDTIISWYYVYSPDNKLEYSYTVNNMSGDTTEYSIWRNDTLIERRYQLGGSKSYGVFNYYNDSVVEKYVTQSDTMDYIYLLDEWARVDTLIAEYGIRTYKWEDDLCVEEYFNGELYKTYTYYDDILNPIYNENSVLRWKSNKKLHKTSSIIDGDYYEFEVVEQYLDYPLVTNDYINGDLAYKLYYRYDIIDDVTEIPVKPYVILSVDYYDIMGRKIDKPTKGFYIERETTNKGIISTKHFIQ